MKFLCLPLTVLALLCPLSAFAEDSSASAPKAELVTAPYAILESFVGGVWSAEIPSQSGGLPSRVEMHFSWLENKQGLRFDSIFVQGNKSAPYTSGVYVWNPVKQKLQIVYSDGSGNLTEGIVAQDGNVLVHDLTVSKREGTVESVRSRLTKVEANLFTNEIFVFKDKAWSRIVEARYQRYR
jgi:hypothetical protein